MAELATIARPYAEALFKAAGDNSASLKPQLAHLAQLAGQPELRQFADNPKVPASQVLELFDGIAVSQGISLDPQVANLLRAVVENGRLAALPQIAAQFTELVNARSGVSDAIVQSAFPINDDQLRFVMATLEKRFKRKLNPTVELTPELIGGIRVVVGDEVLDTSVKARLEQMKVALTA
jgi:F-type H+-transporting ATPase subunit delta